MSQEEREREKKEYVENCANDVENGERRANDEKAHGCCGRWNPLRSLNVRSSTNTIGRAAFPSIAFHSPAGDRVSGLAPPASTPGDYEFLVSSFNYGARTGKQRRTRTPANDDDENHLKRQITRMLSGHDSNYYYRRHPPALADSPFREWLHALIFLSVFSRSSSRLAPSLSSFECDLHWQRCACIYGALSPERDKRRLKRYGVSED